jgi:hypothetical protein
VRYLKNPQIVFLAILAIVLFLRIYKPLELFMYGHDQDLAGWIIKDVVINGHLRLIGQETTSTGVFIGPLFYYLQIPFYLLGRMDPAGGIVLVTIISLSTIFSFYWVFSNIFGTKVGIVASLVYSLSALIVFTDREVVPTTPVMLWSVWFLYGLYLLAKRKQRAYLLVGLLLGLAWNFNLALVILAPLVILAQIMSRKGFNLKYLILGILVFVVTMAPYWVFEIRHGASLTKGIFSSITTQKNYVPGTGIGLAKLDRVFQLVHQNTTSMLWDSAVRIPKAWTMYALTLSFFVLAYKKVIPRSLSVIFFLWQISYLGFFSVNSINISEYYLNGMNVIWVAVFSLTVVRILQNHKYGGIGIIILAIFILFNFYGFFTRSVNKSGYLERKAVASFINEDAKNHGYPCVAVSYITAPGYDFGYRYFFWLLGMHVNQPISGSPVYSIVFPHSKVDRLDRTFGALGLVLPDYARYTKKEIDQSCSGGNSNLTEPMFGYTQ